MKSDLQPAAKSAAAQRGVCLCSRGLYVFTAWAENDTVGTEKGKLILLSNVADHMHAQFAEIISLFKIKRFEAASVRI